MPNRFYRFAYFTREDRNHHDRNTRLHVLRDGDPFHELTQALPSHRYRYGGLLLNYPAARRETPREVSISRIKSHDLLVVTTRLPMHDEREEHARPVPRSYTSLEEHVFRVLSEYLEVCSRRHMCLAKQYAAKLKPEHTRKANIKFHLNMQHDQSLHLHRPASIYTAYRDYGDGPWSKGRWTAHPQDKQEEWKTAAYLLFVKSAAWEGGPGLLASFSMGGTETLIWNHWLGTRLRKLWRRPVFMMAEMTLRQVPDHPDWLDFADEWPVEMLLREEIE